MNNILNIAVPTLLRRSFDYLISDSLQNKTVRPGSRVKVPFNGRELIGIVLAAKAVSDCPAHKLKTIITLIDDEPIIDTVLFQLAHWISDYYQYPIGEVFSTMLPVLLRQGHSATLTTEARYQLTPSGMLADAALLKRAKQQSALIELLKTKNNGMTVAEMKISGFSNAVIKALVARKYLQAVKQQAALCWQFAGTVGLNLNPCQQRCLNEISQHLSKFKVALLDGVTGSGKTEVYLQLIAKVLAQGRQALVLIPEIGLTPQTLQRFQSRFNVPIAILHSQLNDKQRLQVWLQAQQNNVALVIGTRSAIFTPFANLGLIILDEEHDSSFKQQDGLRYSARDIAVVRAQQQQIPIMLGSATPALETFNNALNKRYLHLQLKQRAGGAVKPKFHLLDLRQQKTEAGLASGLLKCVKQHLEQKQQVLLFLNRRGYAPSLICHHCGWSAECKRCDAKLTLHMQKRVLHCHHCDARHQLVTQCPSCGSSALQALGVGTERLEQVLQQHFPNIRLLRIDRDTTRRKAAMKNYLAEIEHGDPCILLGTQMLAKGHHFPNVTLVGIIDVDVGLYSADFRALERTAQLIVQVAGRAGRADKLGEVLIQTHLPEHPLLQTLLNNGYSEFAKAILQERKQAGLPPYGYLALARAEATVPELPLNFLQEVKTLALQVDQPQVQIYGPVPASMAKRAGRFRTQLLLQAQSRQSLRGLCSKLVLAMEKLKSARHVRWSLDIDPMEMS